MPDAQTINAVFSGLVLLLGALAGILTARGRRAGVRRREYRRMEQTLLVAFIHIFALESALAGRGIQPPARPPALGQNADEDDAAPTTTAVLPPTPQPAGGDARAGT